MLSPVELFREDKSRATCLRRAALSGLHPAEANMNAEVEEIAAATSQNALLLVLQYNSTSPHNSIHSMQAYIYGTPDQVYRVVDLSLQRQPLHCVGDSH